MNARLRKEFRDLPPAFAITVLLVGLPFLLWGPRVEGFPFVALMLGSAAMGGLSFGSEFQRRTFPILLSQPVSRSRLWNEKMLALGGALAAAAAWACALRMWFGRPDAGESAALVLIPLCAFAGAPLLTLLARNGIAGGVFAIALPVLLIAGVTAVIPHYWHEQLQVDSMVTAVLLMYCGPAYFCGYKVFSTLQALDGDGQELKLPASLENILARLHQRFPKGPATPSLALLGKEFRLQQISLLTAAVFVAVALAGALLRWTGPAHHDLAERVIASDFFIYVWVLPFLVGGVAFAEERSWGLLEWQLTLPPSGFKQWAAKVATALPANFVLGVMLPASLLLIGWRLFGGQARPEPLSHPNPAVAFCLGQVALMSLACYAGSFSSSTLKAIVLAVAMALASVLAARLVLVAARLICGHEPEFAEDAGLPSWYFVSWCLTALICLFQWLAYHNFRRSGITARSLAGQFTAALGTFVLMVSVFTARYMV